MSVRVLHGDMREVLPTLSGLDACVCDPPYHLTSIVQRFGGENAAPAQYGTDGAFARASRGFMGKQWDGGDIAMRPETWRLVYDALKPGAHLLAFGGSRTFARMFCAIEDAGFEYRDTLMFLYGTGFPKSHNLDNYRGELFCGCDSKSPPQSSMRSVPSTDLQTTQHAPHECGEVLQPRVPQSSTPNPMDAGSHSAETSQARGRQSSVERGRDAPEETRELCLSPVCEMSCGIPEHGSEGRLCDGTSPSDGEMDRTASDTHRMRTSCGPRSTTQRTVKSRAVARQSEPQTSGAWPLCDRCGQPIVPRGLGSALKPAFEPIGLFRKPLIGTVAANVLAHGTGAINVDACRVETTDTWAPSTRGPSDSIGTFKTATRTTEQHPAGRWPANVLHDGSDEVEAAFAAFANSEANPSRYFASFPLFYDNANTILEECQLRIASIAKGSSSLPSASSVSVLTYAVTQASCGEAQLKSCQGLGETVTVKNLIAICRSAIAQILNIEPRLSPERKLDSLTPSYSHARSADQNTPIGITTITISLSKSDGSVEHVICNTMQPKTQSGAQRDVLRFNYSAKASKADRAGSKHPTVKPLALMRWLVRLVTPPGGTVLDCFAGSGTTGEAAMLEGFSAVLVEREDEYIADINRRIERATQERTTIITTAQLDMFG